MMSPAVHLSAEVATQNQSIPPPPPSNLFRSMATSYSNNHDAVGAWFLGPHAENFEVLERIFQGLLYEQAKARAAYFPNDDDFITPSMKASKLFQSKYPFNLLDQVLFLLQKISASSNML